MKGYVGTNFGHGAAAALVGSNGRLLFAVEEGKLSGDKETAAFPNLALTLVVAHPGIDSYQWAEGWDTRKRLVSKGVLRALRYSLFDATYVKSSLVKESIRYWEWRKQSGAWSSTLGHPISVGHHLAHAWSLVPAGLPAKACLLVSDTTAESASISSYYFDGEGMKFVASSTFPHSIGAAFHQLAYHVGFYGRTAPGKLMALSAFGKPKFYDEFAQIGTISDGQLQINLDRLPAWRRNGSWARFGKSCSVELRNSIEEAFEHPELGTDLAASAQAWFTETTWSLVTHTLGMLESRIGAPVQHLGLVGGAALNCQANGCFMERMNRIGLRSLTVAPWSDDAGTAIGAAVGAYVLGGNSLANLQVSDAYLGPYPHTDYSMRATNQDVAEAANELARGGIVALVSGRLEFGPRALGGRCLLADPRDDRLRKKLNQLKKRPDFMPAAPAVLSRYFDQYFDGTGSSHMAWTVQAKAHASLEIPAAVHHNGTARVQVVDDHKAPLLARLLHRFLAITGCPILLLTSLNEAGEPVPATLGDALLICGRLGVNGALSDKGWQSFSLPAELPNPSHGVAQSC